MFLHSGASLHGHEYSNRNSHGSSSPSPSSAPTAHSHAHSLHPQQRLQPPHRRPNSAAQRRNSLFRTAFAAATSHSASPTAPAQRQRPISTSYIESPLHSQSQTSSQSHAPPRPPLSSANTSPPVPTVSGSAVASSPSALRVRSRASSLCPKPSRTPEPVVRFKEPEPEPQSKPESEHERQSAPRASPAPSSSSPRPSAPTEVVKAPSPVPRRRAATVTAAASPVSAQRPSLARPASHVAPATATLSPVPTNLSLSMASSVRASLPRSPAASPAPSPSPSPRPVRAPAITTATNTKVSRELVSEDEGDVVDASDSDASRAGSSMRRARRRAARKSTTFAFAHPPPKLRHRQRIIHTRPKLFLQVQQCASGRRPRPVIDVYPSSAFAKTLVAPLLKRFPRMARTKSELGIQDIMLVKSEDYTCRDSVMNGNDSESEAEDDGRHSDFRSRELVAVLSPLRVGNEDRTEIVLADGSVWVANPRPNGSFDFVSTDPDGNPVTARWVRRQVVSRPGQATPISAPASPGAPQSPVTEYKYTFSIIDPNCRRHPIMATLTQSSLEILESYTTVSQSSSRYPPTSPMLATPVSAVSEESGPSERSHKPVEEWQKNFITISSIWVALRNGWSPNCQPTDLIPPSVNSTVGEGPVTRNRSHSALAEASQKLFSSKEARGPKKSATVVQPVVVPVATPGPLPKRATSTGAAFVSRRRAMMEGSPNMSETSSGEGQIKTERRVMSSDWGKEFAQKHGGLFQDEPQLNDVQQDGITSPGVTPQLAPQPLPTGRTALLPARPMSQDMTDSKVADLDHSHDHPELFVDALEDLDGAEFEPRNRHQRWRSFAGWFKKLGAR